MDTIYYQTKQKKKNSILGTDKVQLHICLYFNNFDFNLKLINLIKINSMKAKTK